MGFENVGKVWKPSELAIYLRDIQKPVWCTSITFHHTGIPTLAQRPNGFTPQHIKNIQSYYETATKQKKAWKSGPHLFIDDDQCWGMCAFTSHGTHAKAFNSNSIGIEVLGDYNEEDFNTGRGRDCWNIATEAGRVLLDWLGLKLEQTNIKFHRDDPKTTKTCPGSKIQKDWVLERIKAATVHKETRV
jgi:N-acetylmuramoyl-L-alanine amidase